MPFNGQLLSGPDKKRKDQKVKITYCQNFLFFNMLKLILKNGNIVATNIQTVKMSNT